MLYWHGDDRDIRMLLRLSVLTGEHANYSQIITIGSSCTFLSLYDYFALLKALYTNTLNFHQYFKDKLSSHLPSHMHNTDTEQIVILTLHFLTIQKLKNVICTKQFCMEQHTKFA